MDSRKINSIQKKFQALEKFFQTSDCAYIFPSSAQPNKCLQNLHFDDISLSQCLQMMSNINQAIVNLKLNFFQPYQIKLHHVIKYRQEWGLNYAICYKQKNPNPSKKDNYDNSEERYHSNNQSQLVWNLGRIWMKFYLQQPIRICQKTSQDQINKLIDSVVTNPEWKKLINKMLQIDQNKRIKFQKYVTSKIFKYQEELSCVYKYSKFTGQSTGPLKYQNFSPFRLELQRRDFMQYLYFDKQLQKVQQLVQNNFQYQKQKNKTKLQYEIYVIILYHYLRLKSYYNQKERWGFDPKQLEEKYQCQMIKSRLIEREKSLNQKKKKLLNSSLNQHDQTSVRSQYIDILCNYLDKLNNLDQQTEILRQKVLFLIARKNQVIFKKARKYLFSDFIKQNQPFIITKIYENIYKCKDKQKLYKLDQKIRFLYFR